MAYEEWKGGMNVEMIVKCHFKLNFGCMVYKYHLYNRQTIIHGFELLISVCIYLELSPLKESVKACCYILSTNCSVGSRWAHYSY